MRKRLYLILVGFWYIRALVYKIFWWVRSLPYRTKYILRSWFYKYFFKYRAVKASRAWAALVHSKLFKIKVKLLHGIRGKQLTLSPMSNYVTNNNLKTAVFESRTTLAIRGPRFLGVYPFEPDAQHTVHLDMPQLEVAVLENVSVIGGTNFICTNSEAIHPDKFLPERDVCPAELNGIAEVSRDFQTVSIYSSRKATMEAGVSLLGSCTGNYAHWLTETLPKLLIVDSLGGYEEYPLLVDSWLHPNFVESISLFNRNGRPIRKVDRWDTIFVKSLVDISPPAYIPPEYRHFLETNTLVEPCAADFPFSRPALNMLRDAAHKTIDPIANNRPRKLYLYRARESCGNTRQVTNIDAIEHIIKDYGYEMLDPAKLSFQDQILTFMDAEKIISPLGAALANTIFTRPACKIIGLSPYYHNANYYYFSNFMATLGHEMYYVLGPQNGMGQHPFHRDYEIDIQAFSDAIEFLELEG